MNVGLSECCVCVCVCVCGKLQRLCVSCDAGLETQALLGLLDGETTEEEENDRGG